MSPTVDFSANRCRPLRGAEALSCRVGASRCQAKSRLYLFGGCKKPLEIDACFSLQDLRDETAGLSREELLDSLSNDCHILSLVSGSWTDCAVADPLQPVPKPRMFHAAAVHDNYMYIRGGVSVNDEGVLYIMNDVWSFDTIDRKWHCFFQDGNSVIPRRIQDLSIYVPSLSFIGVPAHNGVMTIGGVDENDQPLTDVYFFDMFNGNVIKFDKKLLDPFTKEPLILRKGKVAINDIICQDYPDLRFLLFKEPEDKSAYQPLLTISKDLVVESIKRCPTDKSTGEMDMISTLENPILGTFGKNFVVTGFEMGRNRLSTFVYNYSSNSWTKLRISCLHKVYSHRLTMGFVWESHHKVVYLGTSKNTSNTDHNFQKQHWVQYFDTIVVLALPFTNLLVSNGYLNTIAKSNPSNNISRMSPRNSVAMSPSSSGVSVISPPTDQPFHHLHHHYTQANTPAQHINTATSESNQGFMEYSNHVAQQIQVNSIQSVLPSYAIAIGKDAFHRTDALTDFEFVCADGSIVPSHMTLCRRRWGKAFDLLMTDAYAKSMADIRVDRNAQDSVNDHEGDDGDTETKSNRSSAQNSVSGRNSNHTSASNTVVPQFRYPFKDSEGSINTTSVASIQNLNSATNNMDSSSPSSSRRNSVKQLRKTSLPYLSPNPAAQRASLSLSQSRRNSYNHSPSRNNSINMPSRRNSLNLIQQFQSNSRRSSTLSKSSIVSNSPSVNSSSCENNNNSNNSNNNSSGSGNSSSNKVESASLTNSNSMSDSAEPNANENGAVFVQNLPPQSPMPTFMPGGKPLLPEESFDPIDANFLDSVTNNAESYGRSASTGGTSVGGSGSGDISLNLGSSPTFNPAHQIFDNEDGSFHFGRFPRMLYLPYSKPTVLALNEYFYSGQIGASWKVFPTFIELLVASKKLGISLLYDLLLEVVFVTFGMIESELNKNIKLQGLKLGLDVKTCNHSGQDDQDVYCELLCEYLEELRRGSKSSSVSTPTDESTTFSDTLEESDAEEEDYHRHILNDDDLGPKDGCHKHKVSDEDEYDENTPKPNDYTHHNLFGYLKFGSSIAMLDEKGYYSDEDDLLWDYDAEAAFKKFSVSTNDTNHSSKTDGSGKSQVSVADAVAAAMAAANATNTATASGSGSSNKSNGTSLPYAGERKRIFKEWPSVRDVLEGPTKISWISKTLIDMFIEVALLINDNHLLLRGSHVRRLYNDLESMKYQPSTNTTRSGSSLNDKSKAGFKTAAAATVHHPKYVLDDRVSVNDSFKSRKSNSLPDEPDLVPAPAADHFSVSSIPIQRMTSLTSDSTAATNATSAKKAPISSPSISEVAPAVKPIKSTSSIRNVVSGIFPKTSGPGSPAPVPAAATPESESYEHLASVPLKSSPSQMSLQQKRVKSIFGRFKRN